MAYFQIDTQGTRVTLRFTISQLADEALSREIGSKILEIVDTIQGGRLLLNLEAVTFISSVMVGQLFLIHKRCQTMNVRLQICHVSESIRNVLDLVRFSRLVEIVNTESEALAAPAMPLAASPGRTEDLTGSRYVEAAKAGDAEAQYQLGCCCEAGRGVPQDGQRAAEWFRQAAAQGHRDAQYALAHSLAYGIHCPQNCEEAIVWYRKAAERGHLDAQYVLALSHAYGIGVSEDQGEAAAWYHKAAEAGDVDAQENLARAFFEGCGVPQDPIQASLWFQRAAEQGHASAQANLGWMYAQGAGVSRDLGQARQWLRMAADQGHEEARARLAELDRAG